MTIKHQICCETIGREEQQVDQMCWTFTDERYNHMDWFIIGATQLHTNNGVHREHKSSTPQSPHAFYVLL